MYYNKKNINITGFFLGGRGVEYNFYFKFLRSSTSMLKYTCIVKEIFKTVTNIPPIEILSV